MKKGCISVFTNGTDISLKNRSMLVEKLEAGEYEVRDYYSPLDTEMIICIGGDGALLRTVHSCNFPDCPIIGINTGHLGFFQEISPENLDDFISDYQRGEYSIQKLSTVKATVTTDDGRCESHLGLNEILIKGRHSYSIHLDISIGETPIERFSGDGLLVATPGEHCLQLFPGRLHRGPQAQAAAGDPYRAYEHHRLPLLHLQHTAASGVVFGSNSRAQ